MLNDFISSCSTQVKYHNRLQSDLKNLPKVKILKFHFLNWNIIIFDVLIFEMNLMLYTSYGLYLTRSLSQAKKLKFNIQKNDK